MGSPADWRETTAAPHGWGSGRGGGIACRLERDYRCSPWVGEGERRYERRQIVESLLVFPTGGEVGEGVGYRRQIGERLVLLPTGGGVGEEVGSPADWRETTGVPHGWESGRGGGIAGRSERDYCRSPRVGKWERRWDRRQIGESLLVFPTGGGGGEEVGSPADWRDTTVVPHGWGSGRGRWDCGIAGRLERDYRCSPRVGKWERGWNRLQIGERLLSFPTGGEVGEEVGSPADWRESTGVPPRVGEGERRWDRRQIGERLLLFPTGGGVGEEVGSPPVLVFPTGGGVGDEVGSPADWRETSDDPQGWGNGGKAPTSADRIGTTAAPQGWGSGRQVAPTPSLVSSRYIYRVVDLRFIGEIHCPMLPSSTLSTSTLAPLKGGG